MGQTPTHGEGRTSRRAFVVGGLGAAAGVASGGLAAGVGVADAADGSLSAGDAAILRFLSAAEILETDLWQQYNELCGIQDGEVPGGSGNKAYTEALAYSTRTWPSTSTTTPRTSSRTSRSSTPT